MVRVKRRYIVFQIEGKRKQNTILEQDFLNELHEHIAQTYGDFGIGCLRRCCGLKKHDNINGYMILQVRKGVQEMVMSVLPLITKVGDSACRINIIHLSGTIRSSLKHLRQNYIMNLRATIGKKLVNQKNIQEDMIKD